MIDLKDEEIALLKIENRQLAERIFRQRVTGGQRQQQLESANARVALLEAACEKIHRGDTAPWTIAREALWASRGSDSVGTEKTTAWTAEERAEMAEQRDKDNVDAYAKGPDGKPLRIGVAPAAFVSCSCYEEGGERVECQFCYATREAEARTSEAQPSDWVHKLTGEWRVITPDGPGIITSRGDAQSWVRLDCDASSFLYWHRDLKPETPRTKEPEPEKPQNLHEEFRRVMRGEPRTNEPEPSMQQVYSERKLSSSPRPDSPLPDDEYLAKCADTFVGRRLQGRDRLLLLLQQIHDDGKARGLRPEPPKAYVPKWIRNTEATDAELAEAQEFLDAAAGDMPQPWARAAVVLLAEYRRAARTETALPTGDLEFQWNAAIEAAAKECERQSFNQEDFDLLGLRKEQEMLSRRIRSLKVAVPTGSGDT